MPVLALVQSFQLLLLVALVGAFVAWLVGAFVLPLPLRLLLLPFGALVALVVGFFVVGFLVVLYTIQLAFVVPPGSLLDEQQRVPQEEWYRGEYIKRPLVQIAVARLAHVDRDGQEIVVPLLCAHPLLLCTNVRTGPTISAHASHNLGQYS